MRRLPPWAWLMMALIFGATATFMAMGWLKSLSEKRAEEQKPTVVPVVVAAKDVPSAVALAGDQLKVRQWPSDTALAGKFSRLQDVTGRVTATPLAAGEPILESKLAPKGVIPGLTALLPMDKRAMTVKVDEASGYSRTATPPPAPRLSLSRSCRTQPAARSNSSIFWRARASGVVIGFRLSI